METTTKETVEQKRPLLAALYRELNSGHGVTSIKREEQNSVSSASIRCQVGKAQDLSNFRVEYVAPTKPGHSFEPTCAILADSAQYGRACRVFDVPDPDESQREIAEFACRAMNGLEGLVAALEQIRNEFSRHACKHHGPMVCDKCEALRAAEKALEVARTKPLSNWQSDQAAWQPQFSRWRHGGWYVDNLRYPSGAVGCVSRNYPDGKWRIVCDERPFKLQPTFKSRVEAAIAERELIAKLSR